MGNHFYRSHHTSFAAAAMRARMNKESALSDPEKKTIKLLQKCLYNTGEDGYLLSLAERKKTGKSKLIETGFFIHQDSLNLYEDSLIGLSGLSFLFDAKAQCTVSIYCFVKELIDTSTKSQYLSLDKHRSPTPVTIQVPPGKSQEIISTPALDLTSFTESELNFSDQSTFPVVIFIKSQAETLMLYLKIVAGKLMKVREVYEIGNSTYEVLDAYGRKGQECAVCMNEPPSKMLIPCRHVCVCEACLDKIVKSDHKCPICRSYIRGGYNLHG